MPPARNITFAQWVEQTYGPSSRPTRNANKVSDIEYLVCTKYLKDVSESGLVYPAKHPSTPNSFHSTSSSMANDTHFSASTQKTTPEKTTPEKNKTTHRESFATTRPTQIESATTFKNIWLDPTSKSIWLDPTDFSANACVPHPGFPATLKNIWQDPNKSSTTTHPTRPQFATTTNKVSLKPTNAPTQKNTSKPEPELPPLEIDQNLWYPDPITVYKRHWSLPRFEQLEYFVKIKIETFREHLRVHIPYHSHQSDIDREEEKRRRNFFEKHGEQAYLARYIDSDYVGHVEFLYIDPAEVQWKRIGRFGFLQTC